MGCFVTYTMPNSRQIAPFHDLKYLNLKAF